MIYYLLATHLAVGVLAALALVPFRLTGPGFPRFIHGLAIFFLITGLLAGGFTATGRPREGPGGEWAAGVPWLYAAALIPAVMGLLPKPGPGLRTILNVSALIPAALGLLVDAVTLRVPPGSGPFVVATVLGSFAASAMAAGSVCVAMVLGHFYLVIPGLSIRPLIRLCRWLVASLAFRLAFAGLAFLAFGGERGRDDGLLFLWDDVAAGEGLVFWPRLLVGLVAPLALGVMAWRTALIRSTQSATGILYVAVVFTVIGEFLGRFLYLTTHLPL